MKKVVVIGGGAAGIAAACRLAEQRVKVLLLERSSHLGGRAASFSHRRKDEEIDYGHHVLMRCCTQTTALLERLGMRKAVAFQPRLRVTMTDGSHRVALKSTVLPGPFHLLPGLLRYRLLTLQERLSVVCTALCLLLLDAPECVSFLKWLQEHHQGPTAIGRLWDPICVATLNAHANAVSVFAAAKVFRDAFFVPHGVDIGLFTLPLSRIFAAAIPFLQSCDGEIRLRTPVEAILIENGVASGVRLSTGEQIEASQIIAAVPPFDLLPLLPKEVAEAATFATMTQMRWAPIVNLHLWYDRPVMDEPFLIALESPVQAIFNVSQIHGKDGPTHIVLSQSAAQDLINLPNEEIRDRLLAALEGLLPTVRTAQLLDTLVIKHPRATFLPSPGRKSLRPGAQTSIAGLLLAGDYTATGWPSTLEGAVRSGRTAADLACGEP